MGRKKKIDDPIVTFADAFNAMVAILVAGGSDRKHLSTELHKLVDDVLDAHYGEAAADRPA